MQSLNDTRTASKPNPRELRARGHKLIAEGHALVAQAEELEARDVAPEQPKPEPATGLLSPSACAKALGISTATLYRADAPYVAIGARRKYDIAIVRAFFAERGRKPTTPPKKKVDDIAIDDVIVGAGLRGAR